MSVSRLFSFSKQKWSSTMETFKGMPFDDKLIVFSSITGAGIGCYSVSKDIYHRSMSLPLYSKIIHVSGFSMVGFGMGALFGLLAPITLPLAAFSIPPALVLHGLEKWKIYKKDGSNGIDEKKEPRMNRTIEN